MRTALIIGSEGQDGTLLAMYLASKGYCLLKSGRSQGPVTEKNYLQFDLARDDYRVFAEMVRDRVPDEIYFLAAYHHSAQEDQPDLQFNSIADSFAVNCTAFVNTLEIARKHAPKAKIFYASSSLIFSATSTPVQDESTPHQPLGYYALAKSFAMQAAKNYREHAGLFVSTGILYNHESILRKSHFLSKKIVGDTRRLLNGEISEITIGDLSSVTDWGYAPDYVRAMHDILGQQIPGDYIIASGEPHTVEDWFRVLFDHIGRDWRPVVKENKSLIKRKKPVLIGNNTKLRQAGWSPSVTFDEMVIRMFDNII